MQKNIGLEKRKLESNDCKGKGKERKKISCWRKQTKSERRGIEKHR